MKLFSPASVFFLAALGAAAAEPGVPASPALRFANLPLGNVAMVLSARFHAPVTITTNAGARISGDFSGLGFGEVLTAVGRQAGLVARPLGADDSAGFVLEPPGSPTLTAAETKSALEAAARRRAELLRERKALLEQASP